MRGRWIWNVLVDKTWPYSLKKLHATEMILPGRKVVCLGHPTFRDIYVSTFRLQKDFLFYFYLVSIHYESKAVLHCLVSLQSKQKMCTLLQFMHLFIFRQKTGTKINAVRSTATASGREHFDSGSFEILFALK